MTRLRRRRHRDNTSAFLLIILLLSQIATHPMGSTSAPIVFQVTCILVKDRTYRLPLYVNLRLEESRDCIYRLRPPGNTMTQSINSRQGIATQTYITQFFGDGPEITENATVRQSGRRTRQFINVFQWNAQSLSETNAHEVAVLASSSKLDVLCVSELGHRRTIPGFYPLSTSSTGTQSGVFCRTGLPAKVITQPSFHDFEGLGILTQMCLIDDAFLMLHVYIAPRVLIRQRKR